MSCLQYTRKLGSIKYDVSLSLNIQNIIVNIHKIITKNIYLSFINYNIQVTKK